MGNIFKYLQAFGNVIGDIEKIIAAKGVFTLEEVQSLLDDALNDLGLLIPKDGEFFAALAIAADAIIKAIVEGQKLAPAQTPPQL